MDCIYHGLMNNFKYPMLFSNVHFVYFMFALILCGYYKYSEYQVQKMERQAVQRGYAVYDNQTGEWRWK